MVVVAAIHSVSETIDWKDKKMISGISGGGRGGYGSGSFDRSGNRW